MTTTTLSAGALELEILRRYADGHGLDAIADQLHVKRDRVALVVSEVSYQRSTAREHVRQREAALMHRPAPAAAAATPAAAPTRPRRTQPRTAGSALADPAGPSGGDTDQVVTADDRETAAVTTAPPRPEVTVQPLPDTTDQVLRRAEQHPRLRGRVERVRQLVDALRVDLAEVARVASAEDRVEQLRVQLAKATQELKDLTRAGRPVTDGPDAKEVRSWAVRNGVDCTTSGKVPKAVVALYLAAQAAS